MLNKVARNKDSLDEFQTAADNLEANAAKWQEIEALLRKTIGRLSIAARGIDSNLNTQLKVISDLSREKKDDKLAAALSKLTDIIAALDEKPHSRQRRSDPVLFLLELLQGIHFDADQRLQLRTICSDLLISVANGQDRDKISSSIKSLSNLINENFDHLQNSNRPAQIILELISLLEIEDSHKSTIQRRFQQSSDLDNTELEVLAAEINPYLGLPASDTSINSTVTTLLERLSALQGIESSAQKIKVRIEDRPEIENWADTLNEIVGSISDTLTRLNNEKCELEGFIANVTRQLGEISGVIAQDYDDHLSDHEDTQSLQILVKEGMTLLQNDFHSNEDLGQMKQAINHNIGLIKGGVDEFVSRINQRHEATEERNERLSEQLSKMEQETQELQEKLNENREKLLHDTLTGVHSRLAYDEQILKELARSQRYSTEFCYAIIDIDFFKRINDDFGHSAGDKALKIVAQIMLRCSRKSDYVCRIGGEEFVFILPNTDVSQASTVIEKLRTAISETNIHFKKQRVALTVSAGITGNRSGDTADSIYERADAALYIAKNSGRNCQHISD